MVYTQNAADTRSPVIVIVTVAITPDAKKTYIR
jgi:hypothetical protein